MTRLTRMRYGSKTMRGGREGLSTSSMTHPCAIYLRHPARKIVGQMVGQLVDQSSRVASRRLQFDFRLGSSFEVRFGHPLLFMQIATRMQTTRIRSTGHARDRGCYAMALTSPLDSSPWMRYPSEYLLPAGALPLVLAITKAVKRYAVFMAGLNAVSYMTTFKDRHDAV